jgi:hypothetical protein
MPRVTDPNETTYVEQRLRPLLERLHKDRELRADFMRFAMDRGGDASLLVGRLQASWWGSRKAQFTPFFALVLCEFEVSIDTPPRRR